MISQPLLDARDYTGENQLDKNIVKKQCNFTNIVDKIANEILNDVAMSLRVAAITKIVLAEPVLEQLVDATSSKSYSTVDSVKINDGNYVNIKTNYKEEDGKPLLEEYIVDKNGVVKKYDNTADFIAGLTAECLI